MKENEKENLLKQLNEAKTTLNIKKIKALEESLKQLQKESDNTQTKKEAKKSEQKAPKTLEEARKNLEFCLLKEYLKNKPYDKKVEFLNTQTQLDQNLKARLIGEQ